MDELGLTGLADHLLNGSSYRRARTVKVVPGDLVLGEVLSVNSTRNGAGELHVIELRILEPSTAGGVQVEPGEWLKLQVSAAPVRRLLAEREVAAGWRFALQYREGGRGDVVVGAEPGGAQLEPAPIEATDWS